ncbi:MAG: hypothetical protein ACE5HB_05660 [Terriglobia bacterium]
MLALAAATAAPQGSAPDRPLEEIVQRFAQKESEYAAAHGLYRYRLSVKIQEINSDGGVVGEFEQASEVGFDRSGRRRTRLLQNPHVDLAHLGISRVELEDLSFIPLFILAPKDVSDYDVTFLSREKVDEVDTFLFRLEPERVPRPGERFFEGIVWVDADKLDIVRAHGRLVPPRSGGKFESYFQRVEIFREPVDDYLFPTYVRADDVISARQSTMRARLIVRFTHHERVRQLTPARSQ